MSTSDCPPVAIDLPREELFEIYRLALSRSKDLHSDVWNGVRFFTGVQLVALSVVGALAKTSGQDTANRAPIITLMAFAAGTALLGVLVLRHHRGYYLDSLIVTTAVEQALRLRATVGGDELNISLRLPWSVAESDVPELLRDPARWRKRMVFRPGTVTAMLFVAYGAFLLLDGVVVALAIAGAF